MATSKTSGYADPFAVKGTSKTGGYVDPLAPKVRPIGQTVKGWKFTPYKPPPVPTGSYDPAIDAQVGQTGRGLEDARQDAATAGVRDTSDYLLGVDAIGRSQGRGMVDLAAARARGVEDYNTQIAGLARQYTRLGEQQQQQQNAYGVLDGGAVLQAAAKRAANQAFDRQPLDASQKRFLSDNALAGSRLGEDSDLQRAALALQLAPPDANTIGGRAFQDRNTQMTRAEREALSFGLDAEQQKQFQAAQNGYVAPQPGTKGGLPSDQFVTPGGRVLKRIVRDGYLMHVDENGKIVSRRKVKK